MSQSFNKYRPRKRVYAELTEAEWEFVRKLAHRDKITDSQELHIMMMHRLHELMDAYYETPELFEMQRLKG